MNAAECLARSAKAKAAATAETERAALYAVSFGGSSDLAVSAMARVEQLNKAAIQAGCRALVQPAGFSAARALAAEVSGDHRAWLGHKRIQSGGLIMSTYIHIARKLRCADPGATAQQEAEDAILEQARDILFRRIGDGRKKSALTSPQAVRDYLTLTLAGLAEEEFWVLMLDAQHRVMSAERLFNGTLTQTSVYPREVVKAALARNAAAVIFAHNHPSGVCEPSQADELLTRQLKEALAMVDVRVLDHFIVAGRATLSFAERGLL